MPEFRCTIQFTETFQAVIVVKAENEDEVDLEVEKAIRADKLLRRPVIEWELFDDSFEVIEASEA